MRPIRAARLRAHLTLIEATDLCGVTLRTFQRWERGYREPPPAAIRLLEHRADLGEINDVWRGWRIFNDCLHSGKRTFNESIERNRQDTLR
ncbi:MAG: helix-turn-helix domain-containing protein [Gammaproteobacteria bacterium]|nr:helix-turn-helix domain-containing protein [Gammaproteobacteria bacterium]